MSRFIRHNRHKLIVGLAVSMSLSSLIPSHAEAPNSISVTRLGIPAVALDIAKENTNSANNPTVETQVNAQSVWDAISNGQWSKAEALLLLIKETYPDWTPPINLTTTLQNGQHDSKIADMVKAEDWQGILSATADTSHCLSSGDHWARTQALANQQTTANLVKYQLSALKLCDSPDRVNNILQNAAQHLELDDLLDIRSHLKGKTLTPETVNGWVELEKSIKNKEFQVFFANDDWLSALKIADEISSPDMLNQLGWAVLENDPALAYHAFTDSLALKADEEILYGQTLSAFYLGNLDFVLSQNFDINSALAAKWSALKSSAHLQLAQQAIDIQNWNTALHHAELAANISPIKQTDAQPLIGVAWLGMAKNAYENKNFSLAENLAQTAAANGASPRDAKMRQAWSQYHLGKFDAAQENFTSLYLDLQDEESGEGLFFAASANQQMDQLQTLSDLVGGPIMQKLNASKAKSAFSRNDFSTALHSDPETYKELKNINKIWLSQAVSYRNTSGNTGENKLTATMSRTSLGKTWDTHIFEAGIATISANAGSADNSAAVGIPGQANSDGKSEGVSPFISWVREGETQLSARISTTPINKVTSTRPIGDLTVLHRPSNKNIQLKASLYAASKDDSLTSLLGRKDPSTDITYGLAVETGIKAQASKSFYNQTTLTLAANASDITGQNIIDNNHLGASLSGTKSFQHQSFEYIAAGPFYGFDSYDRNTNFHTVGHGGYFSPQEHHRAGVSMHAQTLEARQTVVRFNASTAYETVKTDAADILPLENTNLNQFSGSQNTGIAVSADVVAAHRLSSKWSIEAAASAVSSDAFQDLRVGLTLRFTPAGRSSVTSRHFNSDPLNRDVW